MSKHVKMHLGNETLEVVAENVDLMRALGWKTARGERKPDPEVDALSAAEREAAAAASAAELDAVIDEAADDEAADDILTPEQAAAAAKPARTTRKR
ncbi:hypothetical protein LG274_02665 [Micrococcus antarcticus]|uniref:hypothetical protein n=1 Tax=Micrococcus antarcticus TaxID=86171 RepID=UPI00384DA98A